MARAASLWALAQVAAAKRKTPVIAAVARLFAGILMASAFFVASHTGGAGSLLQWRMPEAVLICMNS
jgi:hypothetical protein